MAADPGGGLPKVEVAVAAFAGEGSSTDGGGGGGRMRDPPPSRLMELKKARKERVCTAKERISRMPPCVAGKRSSIYRGVTRHRWTGRYEAHLWDKSTWNQNQNKKGKQVYLGAYDDEEAAARAYDLAALKYWGAGTLINFPVSDYARDLEEMQMVSKEDYLVSLRRKSSAFSRGIPKYRGLSRQPQGTRWDGSFGQITGSEYFNQCSTSSDSGKDGKFGGVCAMEQKIDLTNYIKWWSPKKARQVELASATEDVGREIRTLECSIQATEPYKLPSFGASQRGKHHEQSSSARSIISRSEVFQGFLNKISKSSEVTENIGRNDDHGKASPLLFSGCGLNVSGVSFALNELPVTGTPYQSALFSAPLNAGFPVDPVSEPLFWSSLVPPAGQSLPTHTKNELGSSVAYQCQD